MIKELIYRPAIVIGLLLGLLLVIELVALGGMTWRNLQRITIIENDIRHGNHLQHLVFELQHRFITTQASGTRGEQRDARHEKILDLLSYDGHIADGTASLLKQVKRYLVNNEQNKSGDNITTALDLLDQIMIKQSTEEQRLLEQVYADIELELKLALGAPVVVLLLALLWGWFYLRNALLKPLENLKDLLSSLIEGHYKPESTEAIDPKLLPLFDNYNRLVLRLSELEFAHQSHTQSLEHEVRSATRTLLEQSRALARTERLAAVGELAASAAHELRNPLAGILVAFENMRHECSDETMDERFQLIDSELKRLARRLNELLASAKHQPEPSTMINLGRMIDELLSLLRYQVDERITLASEVPPGLQVWLPETELRQALLNLLLNASQALSEKPGTVKLTVRLDGGGIVFEVSDDGPGFPEALMNHGIRAFGSQREKGTGLGLLMVRRFAHNMGGQLDLINQPAGLACAVLSLPIIKRHA